MGKFNIDTFFEILSGKNFDKLSKKMPVLQKPDFFFEYALAKGYGFKDPISNFEKRVISQKLMTKTELESIKSEIEKEMLVAVEFAMNSPMPDIKDLYKDVYVEYSNSIQGLR